MIRRAATVALLTASLAAAEDIAALAAKLNTPEYREAADQLAELGPAAKDAVPQLIGALHANDAELRWRAAWALSRIGPAAAPAAPALVSVAVQDQATLRVAAAIALRRIGAPAGDAVLDAMLRAPAWDRGKYADLLHGIPLGPRAVPVLLSLLERDDDDARWNAFQLLEGMGPAAADAVPALVQQLGGVTGIDASKVLLAIGEPSVGPLRARATDETVEPEHRGEALAVLVRIGGTGLAAAIEILERGADRSVWWRVLRSVGDAGPAAAALAPLIAKRLAEGECDWRMAPVLAEMGPAGEAVLERYLFSGECRSQLVRQLANTECDKTVPWLFRLSDQSEPGDVRHAALSAFAEVKLDAEQARRVAGLAEAALAVDPETACKIAASLGSAKLPLVEKLRPLLENRDPIVRASAASALCRLGKGGDKEASILVDVCAKTPADSFRHHDAVRALASAGPAAAAGYGLLVTSLESKDTIERAVAADGLMRMLPALGANKQRALKAICAAEELPFAGISEIEDASTLVDLLSFDELADHAVERLVELGAKARPALTATLNSGDDVVRTHGAYALLRIDPATAGERAWLVMLGSMDGAYCLMEVCPERPDIAIPVLMRALASDDPTIRGSAAVILGKLAHRDATPALRNLIARETDEDARCRELWGLARLLDTQ